MIFIPDVYLSVSWLVGQLDKLRSHKMLQAYLSLNFQRKS